MKTIRLLAFYGTGIGDPAYADEPGLIWAGHVGLQLAGDPAIYGFHPAQEAIAAIGGDRAALRWLARHNTLDGMLHEDTPVFRRAFWLSQQYHAPTNVYVMAYQPSETEFGTIRTNLLEWYGGNKVFPYAWPQSRGAVMPPDRDNCATFPRKLRVAIPEPTGRF